MSSCNTFPTLTRTDQVVTESLSTSVTTHVTTLPPSITTLTLTPSCTATVGQCSIAPIITTSQVPGGTSTVVDTVTITVPITSSQVTTLWGTSCTQTGQDTSIPTPPSSSSTWTPPPASSTWSPSFSTPPPTLIVTSSSSTQADGNVTPVVYTITSTIAPVLVSQTATTGNTGAPNSDNSQNLGPIIGGVVGGTVGLGAILFFVWFLLRRRRRWDDIFDNDDDVPAVAAAAIHKEKQADTNPKPYQYGLVGHTKSPSLTSAPSSPPPGAAPALADSGFDRSHHRNNSSTPLLGPTMSTTTHGASTSPSPRPPSSTGSMQGYGPQDTNLGTQAQIWDPNHLYTAGGTANAAAAVMARRDIDHRTGSPISFQEPRILQVTNADFGPQSPGAGPAISPSPGPQRDGKGRIVTRGEKAPIIHLDGGRYQGATAGSSSAAGPAPPAYSE